MLRPSDWYLMMLNELDEALSAAALHTRIVFLVYADLLWAPAREVLRNPDRFVMMFAPIHRSFYEVLDRLRQVPALIEGFRPVVERNRELCHRTQARSWHYLGFHALVCEVLAQAVVAQLALGPEQADRHWRRLEKLVVETEIETHPVFDVFLFLRTMRFKYRIPQFTDITDV